MERLEPFRFQECFAVFKMTGRKASDIVEFLEIIENVDSASIFFHMHQHFLRPHVKPPEFMNDFANWAADALEEKILAERFANINPFEFPSIEDIRKELIRIIITHLRNFPTPRPVVTGKEFYFGEGVTIVESSGLTASTMKEFVEAVKKADHSSFYYHFYEARLRLGRAQDDFSRFILDCFKGNEKCAVAAAEIKSLDPYMYTTELLRSKIMKIAEAAL